MPVKLKKTNSKNIKKTNVRKSGPSRTGIIRTGIKGHITRRSRTVLSPVFNSEEKERLFEKCAKKSMKAEKMLTW